MVIKDVYTQYVQPHINEIALDIRKDIIRRRITVLAKISADGVEYKYGAYATNEEWSGITSIMELYFYWKLVIKPIDLFDLLDLLIEDLKAQKLIYLEW